ncbi:hypothetical protein [Candidatus Pyrohabitans sp.]
MKAADYLIELLVTLIMGLILINLVYHARRLMRKHGLMRKLRRKP